MFRTCVVCHRSDFADLLVKTSIRTYRHAPQWARRCEYLKAHPDATLGELILANIPGVSSPEVPP